MSYDTLSYEQLKYALIQRDQQYRLLEAEIDQLKQQLADYEKKFTEMDFTIGKALEEAHQYRDKLAEAHQQLAQAQAAKENPFGRTHDYPKGIKDIVHYAQLKEQGWLSPDETKAFERRIMEQERAEQARLINERDEARKELCLISEQLCGTKVEGDVTYEMVYHFVEGEIEKQAEQAEKARDEAKRLEAERDNAVKCLEENFKGVVAIRCMKHYQVPPYNRNEAMGGECPVCEIENRLDLQNDEFKRIKAITDNEEIKGLCDRALKRITQHTPVIVQRDEALARLSKQNKDLKEAVELLKRRPAVGFLIDSQTRWLNEVDAFLASQKPPTSH